MNFYEFTDPYHGPALICVGPNTAVVSVFDEHGFVRTFGGYFIYRDTATDQIYLGVSGTRRASRFRRLMREGGVVFDLRRELPDTFTHGGHRGDASKNWIV